MDLGSPPAQSGSVMFYLFAALFLLAALFYAVSNGTRSGLSLIEGERDKATAIGAQDCTNTIALATKRLEMRGCGTLISSAADGSNGNPGAPSDGSCSIFHPDGGAVKTSCAAPAAPACTLTDLVIGDDCAGVVYAGMVNGYRLYTTPLNTSSGVSWNDGTNIAFSPGATSTTDGMANTDTLVALTGVGAPYRAAVVCRDLGAKWYLPATTELGLLYTNSAALNITRGEDFDPSFIYWSSTATGQRHARALEFVDPLLTSGYLRQTVFKVRCVRKD